MATILIVESENTVSERLYHHLTLAGHECTAAFCGEQAMRLLKEQRFDLMLLDMTLPRTDGFSVIERAGKQLPVICLTARDGLHDRVRGLDMGADDCIIKPFAMEELLARVQAVLRRTKKSDERYRLDETEIDFAGYDVTVSGERVELTLQEFALLEALVLNRNIALSRERLLAMAWGLDFLGDSRTVDVHIQKLRKKLHFENRIKTIYKVGYRLEDPPKR